MMLYAVPRAGGDFIAIKGQKTTQITKLPTLAEIDRRVAGSSATLSNRITSPERGKRTGYSE
jgi:hypothetical protein